MSTSIVTIRDWVESTIRDLTPTSQTGHAFRVSRKPLPLDRPPFAEDHHRSIRVVSLHDLRVRPTFVVTDLEVESTIEVQVGYLARQDDVEVRRWIAEDAHTIVGALTASDADLPSGLCLVDLVGSLGTADLGQEGGNNVLWSRLRFRVVYLLESLISLLGSALATSYPEQEIREWVIAVLTDPPKSIESFPGHPFRHDRGTESLADSPRRFRSFRVHVEPAGVGAYYITDQAEYNGRLQIETVYTTPTDYGNAEVRDRDLEDWLDQDDELILQALLAQRDEGRPARLFGLERIGGSSDDLDGGRNVVLSRQEYALTYDRTT